ncbi:gfo/Idh/MocA family oxidoreductase [Plantibacter flavus]|uniref:Gfo/Idh/MocA family protein n=1 Tax=Plantibacter flavus TaxID=150123 RepID=UPI0010C1D890|nr:Gfo/Idh/MocA family oxidoreductase [Plantibacter flavus]TKJ99767.1 gfo/Idh/MocA family oxidoreductase [Plantibacter flavus]
MSRPHRIAIAGAGIISKQHGIVIDQLRDELELVAVADPELAKAEALVAERGGRAFTTLAEALAQTDPDIVVVCTPTGLHADLAIEALEAGKHVIIEKPADVTVSRTDDIIAAQERAGTVVTVISQHRFDPSTEIVLAAAERGDLGRITSGIASVDWWRGQSYYDSGDWRGTWALDGGGALMNQGVHTVDLLVALLGCPVEVFGYTALLAHERIETEDVAVGVVRFASGALGVIHGSTAVYPGLVARLQVHGDRGSAVIENDQLTYFHSTPAGMERAEAFFGSQGKDTNQAAQFADETQAGSSVAGQMSDAHLHQYRNVLAAIRGEEPLRVTLAENRQAISIITGLYESARTGQPVRLDAVAAVAR